jgi:nicotinate-nucleotide adenylyltransferase
LGGAFNPIHLGHLLCARAVAEALDIKKVVLIPSGQSPHKASDPAMATPEHRVSMCRLAIEGIDGFEVDDREVRRPGPSFTIDTVRQLLREGWPKVPWLLGADQAMCLPTWRQPHDLLREAHFLVMARPSWNLDWNALPPEFRILSERVIPVPAIDISATQIRRRLAAGLPVDFLTPPAVCRYLSEHGLYRK